MPEIFYQVSTSFVIPEIFNRESTFLLFSLVFKYCGPRLKDCRGDEGWWESRGFSEEVFSLDGFFSQCSLLFKFTSSSGMGLYHRLILDEENLKG